MIDAIVNIYINNDHVCTYLQIFDPQSYQTDDSVLGHWGIGDLNILLDHYGKAKSNREGLRFPPLVDGDQCRGEFLPFKRLLHRNRGEYREDSNGGRYFHVFRPGQLLPKLFGGPNAGNVQIYPCEFHLYLLFQNRYENGKSGQHRTCICIINQES